MPLTAIILMIVIPLAFIALLWLVSHRDFYGLMGAFPGTFGWTEGDMPWMKVFWLGPLGFVWRDRS